MVSNLLSFHIRSAVTDVKTVIHLPFAEFNVVGQARLCLNCRELLQRFYSPLKYPSMSNFSITD